MVGNCGKCQFLVVMEMNLWIYSQMDNISGNQAIFGFSCSSLKVIQENSNDSFIHCFSWFILIFQIGSKTQSGKISDACQHMKLVIVWDTATEQTTLNQLVLLANSESTVICWTDSNQCGLGKWVFVLAFALLFALHCEHVHPLRLKCFLILMFKSSMMETFFS